MEQPQDPLTADVDGLRWLYEELLRMERHWTEQVQNQQQRISTLLTVTGILLGFLAGAGFLTGTLSAQQMHWPAYIYIGSLISLCVALFWGILALRPSIPIAGTSLNKETETHGRVRSAILDVFRCFLPKSHFVSEPMPLRLDPRTVRRRADSVPEAALLRALCDEAAANEEKANLRDALLKRRLLIYRQSVFLFLSLLLLIGALVGFLVSGGLKATAHS